MAKKKAPEKVISSLTIDVLNNAIKDEFYQKEIDVVVNGTAYTVLVDNKFETTKIQALLSEMIDKQLHMNQIEDAMNLSSYIMFLVIKYFTDIEACQGEQTYESQMRVFRILLDLDIVTPIIMGIDDAEIKKLNDFMKNASNNVKEFQNNPELVKTYGEIIETIVNQESNKSEES